MAILPIVILGVLTSPFAPDVLHLDDGRSLAGPVVREDAHRIEIATLDGPCSVALTQVVVRESSKHLDSLYRRSRALAAEVGTRGYVALADWCLRKGLGKPLLDTLDELLARDPDHRGARDVLASLARRPGLDAFLKASTGVGLDVPGKKSPAGEAGQRTPSTDGKALARTLRGFRSPGAARRALMVDRIASEVPDTPMRHAALEVLERGRRPARLLAADLLARWRDPRTLNGLLKAAVVDADQTVRHASILAVKEIGHPDAYAPLTRVLSHPRSAYRSAAIDALATLGDPRAVGALIANLGPLPAPSGSGSASAPRNHIFVGRQISLVTDFDVEIASNAVIANPNVNTVIEGALLDVRVIGVSSRRSLGERRHTASALQRLTGAPIGPDHEAWRSWWSAHENDLLAESDQENVD